MYPTFHVFLTVFSSWYCNRALWVAPVDFLVMIFTFLVTVLYNVERVRDAPVLLPSTFL